MPFFDKLAAACLPLVPRPVVRKLSQRYIAGENRADATPVGGRLEKAGYRVTYDLLGEAVEQAADVEDAIVEYSALIEALEKEALEINISLKPTQMGLLLAEELCFSSVSGLVKKANSSDGFVRFEMEDSHTVTGTLNVFANLRKKHGNGVGCVLQAMLFRSEQDAKDLIATPGPLNVRLVKGIYVEPAEIAFQKHQEINQAYLRILKILLEGGAFVAAATHDENLVIGIQEIVRHIPGADGRCEIQMLLGVQEGLRQKIRQDGFPVRVYVPYGSQWYPYVIRRLRKNPKLARYAFLGMFQRQEKL